MKRLLLLFFALFSAAFLQAQNNPTVTPFNGLITTLSGDGIKAKVSVKNRNSFTICNKYGQFGLTNIKGDDTLILTYQRKSVEIPIQNRRSIKVFWADGEQPQCAEDSSLVDSGFGYVKRREYTSSASGLSGEMMVQQGYTDLQKAIAALVPGMVIVNGQLYIRGMNSINSNNEPLIICDGTPISSLATINIHDVKSVEVQKGTNMYGLRGGNGVIIIRTREK
ncbi:MAG: TonB-dependent receptor plug domain-containing protein [Alistipes sp.]